MDSRIAIFNMQDGIPMKRRKYPEIWYWDNEQKTIMIKYHTGYKDEKLFAMNAMNDQDHIDYVFEALYATDWYPADEADRSKLGGFYFSRPFSFSHALFSLKGGCKITRKVWHEKRIYLKLVENTVSNSLENSKTTIALVYPDGTQTDWMPSAEDILAEDWLYTDWREIHG